ncbi:MAG: Asp23/Gls24 family envelope stress response protein [Anaerolineales bacterium]|nr:Asp23/Gls24 family envelope stress response protein [Anaerolineales bacterium]MDD5468203.1 Asp23/Gls24 family envelope stress response protein [Anaerolineales bacterium]
MAEEINPLGSIQISPRAIAMIAYQAALESYGVVGLAPKNLVNGLSQVIVRDPTRGVEVHYDGQQITIDIYVVIEYGTRILSVAESVQNTVRFHVEKALGIPVSSINVHVRGLRVSDID